METIVMPTAVTILFIGMTVSSFAFGVLRRKEKVHKLESTLVEILEDPSAYQSARRSYLANKG